ncbi:MAG: CDP-alcohol phosphatidyltransferase family protein [Ignavibacteria bacterium]|nr:CDP-alcohol phosphatidyltransferase family protein [Ignavibacteria bacterium]
MKKEIFYISNLISLSRFLLLGVAAYFLLEKNYLFSCIMIFLIWVSDLLDGYIARRRGEISEFGKIIDPLADKVSIIVIVVILLIQKIIPPWFVIITVSRDALILAGGLYLNAKKNIVLQSNWLGKMAVFTIGLTLFLSIFANGAQIGQFGNFFSYHNEITELLIVVMLFLSIGMILLSLVSYLKRFLENI